jgi:DNA polymerase-3 subunit delta'
MKTCFNLVGHNQIYNSLSNYFENKITPSSWIISGKKSIGKSILVQKLTFLILGESNSLIHPDLMMISPSSNKDISVDEVRKIHNFIRLAPIISSHKVVIIDDSNKLNLHAANALLKIIEEPHNSIFFLICHNLGKLPPTIISRCRKVKLKNLNKNDAISIISKLDPDVDLSMISQILSLTSNDLELSLSLSKINILNIYNELLEMVESISNLSISQINKWYDKIKDEDPWSIFSLLISRLVLIAIKQNYYAVELIAKEDELIKNIASKYRIDSLIDLWDKMKDLLIETKNSHLDQKQAALVIFQLMKQKIK